MADQPSPASSADALKHLTPDVRQPLQANPRRTQTPPSSTPSSLQANSISADEFIGAVSVDLRRYVERVARDMDMIYIEA